MTVLARFFYGSLGLATLTAVTGFSTIRSWTGICASLLVAGFWIIARMRRISWSTNAGFIAFVVLAMLAAWMDVHPIWSLVSLGAGLTAWDLDHFQRRRSHSGSVLREHDPTHAHIQRLILIEASGLLLAVFTLFADIQLGFWVAVALAVVMFLGINFLLRTLRSGN